MVVLVLPTDILVSGAPILNQSTDTVRLSLCFGILVTALYLVGLIVRRKPRIGPAGLDSILVLLGFAGSLWAYYLVR